MRGKISYQDMLARLEQVVIQNNLKRSKQREDILFVMYETHGHLSPEEILNLARELSPGLGIATVYRTLGLLEKEGLLDSIAFGGDGSKKYELNCGEHHDHLICVECKKIVEFYDDNIEKTQEEIAISHHFLLKNHSMKLYGICETCQK
jgi:Fur family transcriptional regulator, ferric uptake regulator